MKYLIFSILHKTLPDFKLPILINFFVLCEKG